MPKQSTTVPKSKPRAKVQLAEKKKKVDAAPEKAVAKKKSAAKKTKATAVAALHRGPGLTPLFRYPGGKSADLKHYAHLLPVSRDAERYVEPFVGGGATFFRLAQPGGAVADVDAEVVNFYRQVADGRGPAIHALVQQHPNTRANYMAVRDGDDAIDMASDVERAFRFFYLRQTCFRGVEQRDRRTGRFNTAWNTTDRTVVPGASRLLEPAYARLLANTDILQADFATTLADYDERDTFFSLDPPYLPTAKADEERGTEATDRRAAEVVDRHYGSSFTRQDHVDLADVLINETRGRWLLVVADTPLMIELYHGHIVGHYDKGYSMRRGSRTRRACHLIVTNSNTAPGA